MSQLNGTLQVIPRHEALPGPVVYFRGPTAESLDEWSDDALLGLIRWWATSGLALYDSRGEVKRWRASVMRRQLLFRHKAEFPAFPALPWRLRREDDATLYPTMWWPSGPASAGAMAPGVVPPSLLVHNAETQEQAWRLARDIVAVAAAHRGRVLVVDRYGAVNDKRDILRDLTTLAQQHEPVPPIDVVHERGRDAGFELAGVRFIATEDALLGHDRFMLAIGREPDGLWSRVLLGLSLGKGLGTLRDWRHDSDGSFRIVGRLAGSADAMSALRTGVARLLRREETRRL